MSRTTITYVIIYYKLSFVKCLIYKISPPVTCKRSSFTVDTYLEYKKEFSSLNCFELNLSLEIDCNLTM
nr:MAG TPA: hypothetical protein [Bacteriophage sp.]